MSGATRRGSFIAGWAVGVIVVAFMACGSYAQELKATMSGVVSDETPAVIPGVTVTVTNVETGIARSAVSDDQGRYHVTSLAPGNYEVRAELAGFRTTVRRGIQLEMGRTALVDLTLGVGEISEQVVVTGEAPLVNTSHAAMGEIVSRDQIENLPLNGRSFQQLAQLQPGMVVPSKMTEGQSQGRGLRVVAAGTRWHFTQYSLDGIDYNDLRNAGPAGALGLAMGVEAVREFKVLTSTYSAEFGKNAGALISITTRSGTNDFRGSIYEFLRNDNLDARNFFAAQKPEFKRNHFGFLLEGPILRNRTFFLGNYEGLRESLGTTQIARVPDADARRGIIPGVAPFTVDSKIKPALDIYPLPNGRDYRNGTGDFLFNYNQPSRQNFFMIRVDHTLSERDSLYARYLIDDAEFTSASGLPTYLVENSSRTQNAVLEETRIFSPRWVNVLRAGFNRPPRRTFRPSVLNIVSIPGRGSPDISVTGIQGLGGQNITDDLMTAFQWSDDVQHTSGGHNLKFGILANILQSRRQSTGTRFSASWQFNSLQNFLRNRPFQLDVSGLDFKDIFNMRQKLFGVYVQDDWKVVPRLTLNLGLRYEFITEPVEIDAQIGHFEDPYHDTKFTLGNPLFRNPSLKNWGPRFGLAWDPFGGGRTSIRGGFGIFYNQLLPAHWQGRLLELPGITPAAQTRDLPEGSFPTVPWERLGQSGLQTAGFMDFYIKQPYLMHFNLAGQHELIPGTVVTLGYAGSRGVHLTAEISSNIFQYVILADGRRFVPQGARRRNPNWSSLTQNVSNRMSFYHSFQASVNRRLTHGVSFQSAFTLSKAIDEGSSEGTRSTYHSFAAQSADPYEHKWDRGLADFDVRQSFVTNVVYALPFGPNRRFGRDVGGVAAKLIDAWQVSSIVTIASGSPFEVQIGNDYAGTGSSVGQRPDLVPGRNVLVHPDNPDQYFDITAFQLPPARMLGNLGRNTMIGPGMATVDFALAKDTPIGEAARLEFRAQFFNLFNRANFQVPSSGSHLLALFDSSGNRLPQATRLTSTTTTARQIQFGLKLVF